MRVIAVLMALAIAGLPTGAVAQGDPSISSAEPFKLGTFDMGGSPSLGVVLRDSLVVDLNAANQALERNAAYPAVPMPETMVDLIGRYEYGMKTRLYEIVNHLVRGNLLADGRRPAWVRPVASVDILAPLMPGKMLNAAVNFYTHVGETGSPEEQRKAEAERRAKRGVPYLFLKPTRGAVVGDGDDVVIPHGRDRVDWEVELGIVIGRTAKYVSADKAPDHIFGYTVTIDVSDRGGRPPGGYGSGSDWLVGKGHDTFAPMGPWIVPKEFYGDPMKRLRQTLSVDGKVMQEAGAADMIHSIYELIEYGSSIITLFPGDVINNGTSGGTGMGTAYRGAQRFLKPGEKMVATIDGIGTITLPIVGEPEPPPATGSRLPAVSSYRK